MNALINFAAFQIGWFASVLGGANELPWAGPVVVVAVIALHLYRSAAPATEFKLVLACGLVGTLFDSLLVAQGWVAYPSGMFSEFAAPYWIIAMWLSFATTLNLSMAWMKGRPVLAAGMGLVAGPLTYIAGQKLGGIQFVDQTAALVALGLGWAVILPGLMHLAGSLEESGRRASSAMKQQSSAA